MLQTTSPILPFPGGLPADSPVAAPFEAQPGEPITIESLEKGRFLERIQQQIDHAVATLALGADGSSATVTAKVTLTKSGFVHNIKTAVATAAKTEKMEGRVTATVNEAGQLTTFDDRRAAEKPPKATKGKGKKKDAETPPAAEAPAETPAAPAGDAPSEAEAPAIVVETAHEEPEAAEGPSEPQAFEEVQAADECGEPWPIGARVRHLTKRIKATVAGYPEDQDYVTVAFADGTEVNWAREYTKPVAEPAAVEA